MSIDKYVNTFGQDLLRRYGERVHKLTIHAGFSCPNRDGSIGRGGCTFCNNSSFSPVARKEPDIAEQIDAGRKVIAKRTGAKRFIAYFQTYTNTHGEISRLSNCYEQALAEPDVVGLSVGTRPDCVPPEVLDLLVSYQSRGYEVWLELGLQSAFDHTLEKVNRGHGFEAYRQAVVAARERGLMVCTHLMIGLPGEGRQHAMETLEKVLELGVDGLKLHPLHIVKGTMLANQWRLGEYNTLTRDEYISIAADIVQRTPPEIIFHRLTGTASEDLLLAPSWCSGKWSVINALERELHHRSNS